MGTFDRYILGQVVRLQALGLVIAFIVMLVLRLLNLFNLIIGTTGPLKIMVQLIGYLVPRYLAAAVPLSVLLGVVLAFGVLRRDGELNALHSAGLSLFRQTRPVIIAASAVAVLDAAVMGFISPYSRYAYETMLFELRTLLPQAGIQTGVFSHIAGATILVDGAQAGGSGFGSVFIYEQRQQGVTSAVAAAAVGLKRADGSSKPMLHLVDGIEIFKSRQSGPEAAVSILRFRELYKQLGGKSPAAFRSRGGHERELTILELWQQRNTPPARIRSSDMIAEAHGRVVRVLSILCLPFLGVLLASAGPRSSGIASSVVIAVTYEQILDFGENAVGAGKVSPAVGLWLPLLALCVLSVGLFVRADRVVPSRGELPRWLRWLPARLQILLATGGVQRP